MWEALLMLRLMMSAAPLAPARKADGGMPLVRPAEAFKGAIRLTYAAYRLSLPAARAQEIGKNNDRKNIA
jgi:hypothetical protein